MINGVGFLAIASPTPRAASRPAPTSFAPAQGVINLRKERVLAREVELNLREVRFLAAKVPLRSLDARRDVFRRRARLRARGAAAHQPFGGFGGFCRQLKARDPCLAPGDRAEAHGRLKDMIVLGGTLAHGIASGFCHQGNMRRRATNSTRFLPLHSVAYEHKMRT